MKGFDYSQIKEGNLYEHLRPVGKVIEKCLYKIELQTEVVEKLHKVSSEIPLSEIEAYLESTKSMLSTNIQEDFEFGLGG